MSAAPGDTQAIPGRDLVERGVADLRASKETAESLLVSIGATRLRSLGLELSSPYEAPEHRLYRFLAREKGDAAHSAYNALVRRLVSFERAVQCARSAGWQHVATRFGRAGKISFHHFDPVAPLQGERGHEQDLRDVERMIGSGLVDPAEALAQFESIEPKLYRFPAIDRTSFRVSVEELFG